jgi:hypothetical protein
VGLERGPLSLVSTTEELLGRNSSGSGRRNPLRWPRDTLCLHKLALSSPTCGGYSVGIVRLRTKATSFLLLFLKDKFETFIQTTEVWIAFTATS